MNWFISISCLVIYIACHQTIKYFVWKENTILSSWREPQYKSLKVITLIGYAALSLVPLAEQIAALMITATCLCAVGMVLAHPKHFGVFCPKWLLAPAFGWIKKIPHDQPK